MRRRLTGDPPNPDLLAKLPDIEYVGSSEHKSYPSFAGPPRLRSDASQCDPSLGDAEEFARWIREGVKSNMFSEELQEGFPKYVWIERDGEWFEARLVNKTQGQYKGYPILESERPLK